MHKVIHNFYVVLAVSDVPLTSWEKREEKYHALHLNQVIKLGTDERLAHGTVTTDHAHVMHDCRLWFILVVESRK